jgi:septum formation protein
LVHTSDEQPRHGINTFQDYVLAVAQGKMRSLRLPEPTKTDLDHIYALTADTLIRNPATGQVFGKPTNRDHAIKMLKAQQQGVIEIVTGCCLEKFNKGQDGWHRAASEHWVTGATAEFFVDDDSIDTYLKEIPIALKCSGAGYVEDHGLRYLKSINGSFSAVIGLPLYELCINLKKIGFKL